MSKLQTITKQLAAECLEEFNLEMTSGDRETLNERFEDHENHEVEVGRYGSEVEDKFLTWNIAVECMDCFEVLLDSDALENSDE